MLRSSSGVPWRPPAMRALCTETPSGAMRQNSVSMVVLIEGTKRPMRPRHPYIGVLLSGLSLRVERAQKLPIPHDGLGVTNCAQRRPHRRLRGRDHGLPGLILDAL